MEVDLCTYRARIGCFRNPAFHPLCCWQSCLLVWMAISQLMLKLAGDVEENPGPRQQSPAAVRMGVDLCTYRARIGCFRNLRWDSQCCSPEAPCLLLRVASCLLVWMVISQLMLKLAGDVEENPGPRQQNIDMAKLSSFKNKMKPKEWDMIGKRTLLTLNLSREYGSDFEPLAQLPEEVFELQELEVLDLTGNKNIDISDQLTKLTNLKVLCLHNCNLKTVPAAVMKLPQLEMLILSYNENITLPDEMSGLINLTVLDLENCNLDTLPPVVLKLSNLQELDLSADWDSKLKISLPDELSNMNKLKGLRLHCRKLDTIPQVVLKLPQLEELDLSGNSGIHLPDGLAGLTNLRVLKLAGAGMETVPPVVLKLPQLEELDLSGNSGIHLPDGLAGLTNLRVLKLAATGMKTVPPVVCRLTQLDRLNLNRNKLQTLPAEIGQLTNLKHLDLSGCKLLTLPPELGRLTQLEWLDLSNNQLQTLPAEIGQLTNVKHLDLYGCELLTLPPELGRLTQLEWLRLTGNQLQTLPPEVWRLAQLEELHLSRNQLQTLPAEIGQLTNVKHLYLSYCKLRTLPPEVGRLRQLERLDLSRNQLQTLPAEIGQLTNVKRLDLPQCELRTLPPEVGRLTQLEWLDLSGNQLQTLPAEIGQLTNLKHLDLSGCELRTLPPEVWRLTQLEWLDLSGNQLQTLPPETLPAEIGQLTNVKHLDLSMCGLRTLPPEVWRLTQLERLDLSWNQLQTLPAEIGQLTNVKRLDLSRCKLRTLPPEVGRLTQLEWLNLSFNKLQMLPAEIGQLTNVKHLDLSGCELRTLPPEVGRLTQLERLDLTCNQLQTLPAEVGRLTQLEWLYLSWNQLQTLPAEVWRLTQLERLDLSNNQLQTLPTEVGLLNDLCRLEVSDNALTKPPAEVCSQGIAAIRQYFEELGRFEENTSAHLKVVILGEKMAGKTSLVQTLDSGESTLTEVEDRTHCVEITQWAPDDNITFEVFDFGGQDVYHLTHQFFLTPDAFHLLLVNLQTYRCSEERYTEAVGFWLDTLNARVPGAVVTIVGSKKDMCSEAEINGKVKDIEEKFQKQMDTWKRNTERQIREVNKRSKEAKSDEEKKQIKQQLERTQSLLKHPLRLIGMYCISSAEPTSGLDTLKNHILESANNTKLFPTLKKILPRTWVEFEQKVYGLRDKGTEELEITRGEGDKSSTENNDSTTDKKQVTRNQKWITQSDCLELTDLPADRLEQVLSYLQQVGTILRYTDIPELKDYVFHDPPALIEIFKDLFHHEIKALFSTRRATNADYTCTQLEGFQIELQKRGLIRKDVMTCLLPSDINPDIVTALMQHFGLCFEIIIQDKTDPSKHTCWYRVPWYLQEEMPQNWKSVWPDDVPEDQEQLQLMCNITGFCPRGLFQRFSVGIHPLVKDSLRVDWKDGVMAYKKGLNHIIMVSSKPVSDDTYITMATRGRLAQADEMWGVVHPLLEVLVQLLQEWPGVLYSLHVTCAHCIKAGQDNPWKFDLRDRTAKDHSEVWCEEVEFASTSADLVYRPARLSAFRRGPSLTRVKQENDCYKMTSDPRGVALIISNTIFTDPTRNRPGGAKDLDRLGEICGKLKLQQEIKQNLTAQQIEAVTKEVSKRDHSSYDCFVLFLLSHGTETGVLGTDGQHVSVDSIISSFQACKSLVGKPKLFFIQACRGGDRDKGLEQTDSATDEASSTSQTRTEASNRSTEATVSPPPPTITWVTPPAAVESPDAGETLPTASDRLVMYATVHGHVSWRNSETGTWLVEALADVITEHADMKELHDMLMMVNAKVAKTQTQEHKYKQQSEVTHTLRKRLYFFPSSSPESSPHPKRPQDQDVTRNPPEKEGGKDEVAETSRESSDQHQDHNVSGNPPEELESAKVPGTSAGSDVSRYFRYVKNNATAEWKDLGEELGLSWAEVTDIEKRYSDDKSRCRDTLQEWKKRKGETATITVLMDALRKVKLMSVVDGLKNEFPELEEHDAPGNPPADGASSRQDSAGGGQHSKGPRLPVIVLINDEYGTSKGGISTINCQASQTLASNGAVVYATVLQLNVPKEDQEAADRDGVTLIKPVQIDKESVPSLDWLTKYHSVHFPDLPKDVTCIIGHADITDTAARNIHNAYYKDKADLIMFTHVIREDTEYYKGGENAMKAREKENDMLDKVDNAKAAFSVGKRIFDHFSTKYKGDKKPDHHHIFLPKPSELFLAKDVKPGGGQKVVLSIGRVRKVEKLKGHDLVGESMREVIKTIKNARWCVRGISKDDFETSKKILEDAMNSLKLNPTLLPYGTQEEIRDDMMKAHLVLMPSRSEPFGLVGLEAIAAGIPVLISDQTGLADMITDLIQKGKLHPDRKQVIVETSVNDRDRANDVKRWADRIVHILNYSKYEFEKAARFKQELVASRYWEESHNAFLQACGVTAGAADQ
ncbi:PREDICTED: uncharacterized protein LOC109471708 [Branchiostoma belcheri]|uniref:Leucine-rich repeat protein SHOC-2 n=1 Tax=Branchiostoma belcheri TaxID=7741 RepID=A0A6P4Z6C9_BRABE|nr:PREDICTED: uncharacterized protein LOC109471708 [Branchiostoma belcheri]